MIELLLQMDFPSNPAEAILKSLAVLGGAVVGGLASGALGKGGTRLATGKQTPKWAVHGLRLTGGGVTGVLLAMMIFTPGEGGGGWGGGGGLGLGQGTGSTQPQGLTGHTAPAGTTTQPTVSQNPTEARPLRVEVVFPLAGQTGRWYRLEREPADQRRTISELKELIRQRSRAEPPLKQVVIVLYKDSPERSTGPVQDLEDWLNNDAKLRVRVDQPGENAPK